MGLRELVLFWTSQFRSNCMSKAWFKCDIGWGESPCLWNLHSHSVWIWKDTLFFPLNKCLKWYIQSLILCWWHKNNFIKPYIQKWRVQCIETLSHGLTLSLSDIGGSFSLLISGLWYHSDLVETQLETDKIWLEWLYCKERARAFVPIELGHYIAYRPLLSRVWWEKAANKSMHMRYVLTVYTCFRVRKGRNKADCTCAKIMPGLQGGLGGHPLPLAAYSCCFSEGSRGMIYQPAQGLSQLPTWISLPCLSVVICLAEGQNWISSSVFPFLLIQFHPELSMLWLQGGS